VEYDEANSEREERDQKFAALLGRTSPDEARKQMIIGGKHECLDKIEQCLNAGVTHFILVSMRPFEVG
jgi:alkanesulfonate monooxygenase SsuD/methylene tetrahydromethanopterin reductase-like flavin-dependent oxidoreductase (luciferase family)